MQKPVYLLEGTQVFCFLTSNEVYCNPLNLLVYKAEPYKISDGGGMYLPVHPNGSKYWRLGYRFGGKQKNPCLGSVSRQSRWNGTKTRLKVGQRNTASMFWCG
jgi:hypothetical protein